VNRSAEWAQWDDDLLKLELDDLRLADFDLELIGFDGGLELDAEPTIKEQEYSEQLTIVIECASETEQEQLFQEFQGRGLKCRVQSL